jgi:hypothetical protein
LWAIGWCASSLLIGPNRTWGSLRVTRVVDSAARVTNPSLEKEKKDRKARVSRRVTDASWLERRKEYVDDC